MIAASHVFVSPGGIALTFCAGSQAAQYRPRPQSLWLATSGRLCERKLVEAPHARGAQLGRPDVAVGPPQVGELIA